MQNNKIVIFEKFAFVLLIILGILWMFKPESNIEPFFAFVSLSFISAELYRRGIIKFPEFGAKDTENISCLETSDEEFLFLEKLQKFNLTNNIYNPQSDELEICISLANQGYFIKDGDKFQLTANSTRSAPLD